MGNGKFLRNAVVACQNNGGNMYVSFRFNGGLKMMFCDVL